MYDTLSRAYVHVFQTVIPRNRLPRMVSTNQARYSSYFLAWFLQVCNFKDRNHLPILHRKLPKNPPPPTTSPPKTFSHTPEVYRKIIHRNWKFTHKKHIRRKLIMTSTSSKLEYCVQKTTIQRDVGLRIYYFAYMNSPPLS